MNNSSKAAREALIAELMGNRSLLFCQALKVVRSHAAAEDVLQDAALKCLASPPSEVPIKLRGYVSRIVRNTAIDYVRKHRNEQPASFDDENSLVQIGSDPRCGFTRLENKERLRTVTKAISDLPQRHQDAFIRHRLAEIPQKQIAEELSVSRTLVNFMIRDADAACKQAVEV
jgi:RNA polymerase sigma-70 factor (ECF subfamily)